MWGTATSQVYRLTASHSNQGKWFHIYKCRGEKRYNQACAELNENRTRPSAYFSKHLAKQRWNPARIPLDGAVWCVLAHYDDSRFSVCKAFTVRSNPVLGIWVAFGRSFIHSVIHSRSRSERKWETGSLLCYFRLFPSNVGEWKTSANGRCFFLHVKIETALWSQSLSLPSQTGLDQPLQ